MPRHPLSPADVYFVVGTFRKSAVRRLASGGALSSFGNPKQEKKRHKLPFFVFPSPSSGSFYFFFVFGKGNPLAVTTPGLPSSRRRPGQAPFGACERHHMHQLSAPPRWSTRGRWFGMGSVKLLDGTGRLQVVGHGLDSVCVCLRATGGVGGR
jgi:hypothetical protein